MKNALRLLAVLFTLSVWPSLALADGAGSPAELASLVRQAIADKDAKAIADLFDWTGVSPEIAGMLRESIEGMLDETPRKADVRPLPDDFHPVQELGDRRFRQNLDAQGVIMLVYSPKDESMIATLPYGEKDGRYFFTAPVEVR